MKVEDHCNYWVEVPSQITGLTTICKLKILDQRQLITGALIVVQC